jgi:hypothetical protein
MSLFIKDLSKGTKSNGYKLVKRRFPSKKKRTCYRCGSTKHIIAECPLENNQGKNKKERNGGKRRYKNAGEADIGHEWDSTKESSDEDEEVATVTIHKTTSSPRLFNNLFDDDDSHHICLMAKGDKVKLRMKSPSPPPSDISSSELSDSSDDTKLAKSLDPRTKLFITTIMEELEHAKAELENRENIIEKTEKLYIDSEEALELERRETTSLSKALFHEQKEHALTKKANIALNHKYCVLMEKHNKLEEQYSLLWESTSYPPSTSNTSKVSTSEGCRKSCDINMNAYSTNLANMKAMKDEIARLNSMLDTKGKNNKKVTGAKVNQPKP